MQHNRIPQPLSGADIGTLALFAASGVPCTWPAMSGRDFARVIDAIAQLRRTRRATHG